jgi:fructose-bisphosphate aldolase class I
MERCSVVTEEVLRAVFASLDTQRVALDGMILKPNMVLPGRSCTEQPSLDQVAAATVTCLKKAVPIDVAGIAFLSGGQSSRLASERLNTMNFLCRADLPWPLAFSFARAIQQPALEIWKGIEANIPAAQMSLNHRALCNKAALHGNYTEYLETH